MSKKNEKKGFGAKLKSFINHIFLFLLTFIIFYSLSLWTFSFFAKKWRLWKLQGTGFSTIFIIMIFAGYLILSVAFTYISNWYLRYSAASKEKSARVKKYNAWALLIGLPLVIGVSLVLLYQPINGETMINRARRYYSMIGEYSFLPVISETIITAEDADTKAEGLKALASIHTKMCLQELVKILEHDKEALNNKEVHTAMKKAFISYDLMAKPYLLELFYKYDREKPLMAEASAEMHLHNKFFAPSFKRLQKEAKELNIDGYKKNELLLRIEEIENEVKNDLLELEQIAPRLKSNITLHDFILDVFLDMERLVEDKEIYNLAKRIAANDTYRSDTRAKAIMLIAKLGTKKDFYTVAPLLSSDDEIIKTAALKAITRLHEKSGGQKEKK